MHIESMAELNGGVQKHHRTETLEAGMTDRISNLPEPILIHILGLLPLEVAVRTCLLSKRWVHLWTTLPTLSFCQNFDCDFHAFVSFVDNIMMRYSAESIHRFMISFCLDPGYEDKLPNWLGFASRHDVRDLEIELFSDPNTAELPVHLCAPASVTSLLPISHKLVLYGNVMYPCLRYLELRYVNFLDENVLEKLLIGSPVLEELRIWHCPKLKQINVSTSVSLKRLVIYGIYDKAGVFYENTNYDTEEDEEDEDGSVNSLFRIRGGPNLQYFRLTAKVQSDRMYRLEKFPSLVEADLQFQMGYYDPNDRSPEIDGVIKIVSGVSHVEKLTLSSYCFQMLILGQVKIFSSLPKIRFLTLLTFLSEMEAIGHADLLESSCNLEELIIMLEIDARITPEEQYYEQMYLNKKNIYQMWQNGGGGAFQCLHLKKVQVVGLCEFYYKNVYLYPFLEFLLRHAVMLEELSVITAKSSWKTKEGLSLLSKASQTLLSFPRASENTNIIFA